VVEFSREVFQRVSSVELVPPIWFSDSDEELPNTDRPCVAVFDVTPVRPACLPPFTPEIDYRNYAIGRQFLEDVYSALSALGFDMMWKRKRAFGPAHDRRYIRFANELATRPGVLDVPPGISAFRVVDRCTAVISIPFTSTGLIGVARSRPSVFYDPSGLLLQDDRAAQGIPLLSTRAQLAGWLSQ
jgi:polysaccharide biosynthesis PFTS motif protein